MIVSSITELFGFEVEEAFDIKSDHLGLVFTLDKEKLNKARKGDIGYPAVQQFLTLTLLLEQGLAEEIGNGYAMASDIAVQLDTDIRDQLGLPEPWMGSFRVQTSGTTVSEYFRISLSLLRPDGQDAGYYRIDGPFVRLSDHEVYLPNEAQWMALASVQHHQKLVDNQEEPSETDNLLAIHAVQNAQLMGLNVDLGPFRNLYISKPEKVRVTASETPNGDLVLTPSLGAGEDPEDVTKRLGQVIGKEEGTIRVGDRIIVLDMEKMKGVQEVIQKRRIRKEDVPIFLKNPTAFLDAALVDLDLGFSIRVKGATVFQLAYFGETEDLDIDWFNNAAKNAKYHFGPHGVRKLVKDLEDVSRFRAAFENSIKVGAKEFCWEEGVYFRFEDTEEIWKELEQVEKEIREKPLDNHSEEKSEVAQEEEQSEEDESSRPVVVDIDTQDSENTFEAGNIPTDWRAALDKEEIDTSLLHLTPYDYQDIGIRWILGLVNGSLHTQTEKPQLFGSLLADDMGLGKTFMSLAAIAEYYRRCRLNSELERPVLVVAPLGLLENWKDEVDKVFTTSPFSDIVILQGDAALHTYRIPGKGREINQNLNSEDTEDYSFAGIEYSLKTRASGYLSDALDQPKRLVLTGYTTLRDHMFSLSRIDWSFVIFDEAQNIKNPNALQTRAAKGLKAQFRLIVTGTPVENELKDFWCLLDTARPGLLGAYQDFRQSYVKPILNASPEDRPQVRLGVGKELRDTVGGLMLRRLKEDNLDGLPTKNVYVGTSHVASGELHDPNMEVTMHGLQLDRYESVIDVTRAAKGTNNGKSAVLLGLQQLRNISLHPDCIAGGSPRIPSSKKEAFEEFQKSGKLAKLLEIIDQIKKRNEKVIVFCINKRLQMLLQTGLQQIYDGVVHVINGDTKAVSKRPNAAIRKRLIQDFENHAGFAAIIMSPVAAGVGLTVVGANNVVHLERHWNPAKESQATDRVYRIGQEKPVNIYVPILHHPELESFDVNMAKLLAGKVGLRDAIVTPDVVTPEEMLSEGIFGSDIKAKPTPIDVNGLRNVSWKFFEALIAEIMAKEHDADTYMTPASNDYGCDVVVLGSDGENRLIQCKHTNNRKLRGHKPIQEVFGARPHYQEEYGRKFQHMEVYTNAVGFDSDAVRTAKESSVVLYCFKDIKNLLKANPVTDRDVMHRLNMPC